jgi:hypothetical protein
MFFLNKKLKTQKKSKTNFSKMKQLVYLLLLLFASLTQSSYIPNGRSWITTDKYREAGRNNFNHMNFFSNLLCPETAPYLNKTIWSYPTSNYSFHLSEPSSGAGRVFSTNRDGKVRSYDENTGSLYFEFDLSDWGYTPVTEGEWREGEGYGLLSPTAHSRSTPMLAYPFFGETPDKAVILDLGRGGNSIYIFDPMYEGDGTPELFCKIKLSEDPALIFSASAKYTWYNGTRIVLVGSSSRGEFYLLDEGINPQSKGTVWAVDIDNCETVWETSVLPNRTDYAGGSIVGNLMIDAFNDIVYASTQNNYITKQEVLDCLLAGNADCSHLDEPDNYVDSLVAFNMKGKIIGAYSDSGPSIPDVYDVTCSIPQLSFLCQEYSGDDQGPITAPMGIFQISVKNHKIDIDRAVAVGYKRGYVVVTSKTADYIAKISTGPGSDQGGGIAFNGAFIATKNHGIYFNNNPLGVPYTTIHNETGTGHVLNLVDFNTNTAILQVFTNVRCFSGLAVYNERYAGCLSRSGAGTGLFHLFDIYDGFNEVTRSDVVGFSGNLPIFVRNKVHASGGYVFIPDSQQNNKQTAIGFDTQNMPAGLGCF